MRLPSVHWIITTSRHLFSNGGLCGNIPPTTLFQVGEIERGFAAAETSGEPFSPSPPLPSCLSGCMSVWLPVCLFVCPSFRSSIGSCLFVCLFVCCLFPRSFVHSFNGLID